ncbi:MAG: DUF1311 domain-containing protein [Rhizobium sp.]|nr:DUF1311 domain-containing protein [Rhizobium sp.]MBX9455928.1 DUF1311 domain-containing protein [Rhizobium sp.]
MKRLAITALLVASAACAQAQEDPPLDCSNQITQSDMNQCSYLDYERADKELNAVYRQAVRSQEEMDKQAAEMNPAYVGALKALKKAQRAWIDYRDGHCDGVGYAGVGGSIQPLLINGCLARLTENRTKELRELIEGLGN